MDAAAEMYFFFSFFSRVRRRVHDLTNFAAFIGPLLGARLQSMDFRQSIGCFVMRAIFEHLRP